VGIITIPWSGVGIITIPLSEVFWISTTQLEFCERIHTWDGQCWADKNGVSRTSYLMDKGIIAAGYKGGGRTKNLLVA
jgi:hypothetical protein